MKGTFLFVSLLLFAVSLGSTGLSQIPVSFVDPRLEAAIREQLQMPTGDLTDTSLQNLVWLNAYNRGITNLSGIEFASRLESLGLEHNAISDLAPLSTLRSITCLKLERNQITNLAPLTNLTNLQGLFIDGNPIPSISSLQSLPNLRSLSLGYLPKLELAGLACFTNLADLWVWGDVIRDPAPLLVLTNLRSLSLDYNPLNHPRSLAAFTNLTSLSLGYTSLSNLDCIAGLTALTYLSADGTGIRDLAPLRALTNLTTLYLSETHFDDYSVLGSLPKLQTLSLDFSQSIDISSLRTLSSLKFLNAEAVGITDLGGLTNLTQLQYLNVMFNGIQNLEPVKALTNLIDLIAGFNRITDIEPLSNFGGIGYIGLEGNLLDLNWGSPTMTIIEGLTNTGLTVIFQPQRQPPAIRLLQTNWVLAMNRPAWKAIHVFGEDPFHDVITLFATVSDPSLITNVEIMQEAPASALDTSPPWHVRVSPAFNQTGCATLTLSALDDLGFITVTNVEVQVVEPRPFPGGALNSTNLPWFTTPDQPWFRQDDISHSGFGSAQSGAPDSWIATTVTGPGTLTFWTKAAPEPSAWLVANCLESGVTVMQDIGWQDWHKETIGIPSGTWALSWYPRFGAWFVSSNTMWLGEVSYVPGTLPCSLELVSANRANFTPPIFAKPDGSAWLALHGELGGTYLLESSPDLLNWSPLTAMKLDQFTGYFGDVDADLPARFYRARRMFFPVSVNRQGAASEH